MIVRLDGSDGHGCELGPGDWTLGGADDSTLRLPDAEPLCARLLVRPFAVTVRGHAAAGTFVNGIRLEAPTVLTSGDRLRIGAREWSIHVDAAAEPSANPNAWPARLEIIEGERVLTALTIDHGQVRTVGRTPEADLTLADRYTSRRHALLRREGETLIVRDAGSINGVTVAGQRVREARLRDGETVVVGRTEIRFRLQRPEPAELDLPTIGRLGPYNLFRELGRGGMGVVYEAQRQGQVPVALKIMRTDRVREEVAHIRRRRFEREGQVLGRIKHENVVGCYETGVADGKPFLALELLDGEALIDVLRRREQLPNAEIERIVFQLCAGARAVHEAGVVHRDIKPANVILSGPKRTVKLMDFGIARLRDAVDLTGDAEELTERAGETMVTAEGRHPGTPLFMSPEQIRGKTVDMRSDIWSLGVLLYLLAAGRAPFSAVGQEAIKQAALSACPTPLPDRVPAYLRSAIYRCLLKSPNHRFASATELMEALHERRIDQPVPVGADGPVLPPPSHCPSCGSYVTAKQADCPVCKLDLRPFRSGHLVTAELDGQFLTACGRCGQRAQLHDHDCRRCGHLFLAPRTLAESDVEPLDENERLALAEALRDLAACPVCGTACDGHRLTCAGCGLQLRAAVRGWVRIRDDEHGVRWPHCAHCGTRLRQVRADGCAKCGWDFAAGRPPAAGPTGERKRR